VIIEHYTVLYIMIKYWKSPTIILLWNIIVGDLQIINDNVIILYILYLYDIKINRWRYYYFRLSLSHCIVGMYTTTKSIEHFNRIILKFWLNVQIREIYLNSKLNVCSLIDFGKIIFELNTIADTFLGGTLNHVQHNRDRTVQ